MKGLAVVLVLGAVVAVIALLSRSGGTQIDSVDSNARTEQRPDPVAIPTTTEGADSSRSTVAESAPEVPEAEPPAVDVVLTTRTHFGKTATVVPNVTVDVGVVWARRKERRRRVTLATVTTDRNGHATASVAPLLEWLEDRPAGSEPRVWARARGPGWMEKEQTGAFDLAADEPTKLTVMVHPGGTLRGVVEREDGSRVTQGRVFLRRKHGVRHRESIDCEGRFEIDFHETGTYTLSARSDGVGASESLELGLSLERDRDEVVVVLRGPGLLAGVVRDPDGRPLRNYRLWAVREDHRGEVHSLHDKVQSAAEATGGLVDGHANTDLHGRFRIEGLQDADYVIRGSIGGESGFAQLMTTEPVAAGTEGLELTAPYHRLVVRALSPSGEELAFEPRFEPNRSGWGRPLRSSRGERHVYVHESDGQGRLLSRTKVAPGRRARGKGESWTVAVAPGRSYLVGLLSLDAPLVEREVFVGDTDYVIEVDLRPAPISAPGILKLQVLDPLGNPMESSNQVTIFAPASGKLLVSTNEFRDEANLEVELGPGTYRVRITADSPRGYHGERLEEELLAPTEHDVVLRAGEVTSLDLTLAPAGRARVTVALEGEPETSAPILPSRLHPELRQLTESVRVGAGGVRVDARPADGSAHDVIVFPYEWIRERDSSSHVLRNLSVDWVVPKEPTTSVAPLRAGEWIFTFEREGYAPVEVPATVRQGEVTDVEATLRPR